MRFRVKHRAAVYADKVKPEYYDGYSVFCPKCKAVAQVVAETYSDALEIARNANSLRKNEEHVYEVAGIITGCIITDIANTMVIWIPQADGVPHKQPLTFAEYGMLFERVEV